MTVFNPNDFDSVFPPTVSLPYTRQFAQNVDTFRKTMGGTLFIDRILMQLGVTKSKLYPPKTEDNLRALHKQITSSPLSEHQKYSIFYYLLLDFDVQRNRSTLSEVFATDLALPETYHIFMRGLWHLDRQEPNLAIEFLTHPALKPEFGDEIVTALVSQANNGDYNLALAYYHTVQPNLKTDAAIRSIFGAIAKTNVVSGLEFSRKYPTGARKQLFQLLIQSVLDAPAGEHPAHRATELVSLPLEEDEDAWFEEYLSRGDGKKLNHAKDTLLMRKIVTGRYSEAIGDRSAGGKWGVVLEGLKSGAGGRD